MNTSNLRRQLHWLQMNRNQLSMTQRMEIVNLLIRAASDCLRQLNDELHEADAATNRRKAKRRETEVDPKPPVKPVTVAEPSKPKKPKYSGL